MIHFAGGKLTESPIPLSPTAPGFRYGAGYFETLYYNGRDVCHLELHLDRLLGSLRSHGFAYRAIDFAAVINQVIKANGLTGTTARINIVYPVTTPEAMPVILAAPYEPSPYKAYRLCICEDRHVSTLNAHKTNSYMFFHLALRLAKANGFDDAALFDFDDHLLEAATGAILLSKNGDFFQTLTPYKLPSTAQSLAGEKIHIQSKPIGMNNLHEYRHAYLLNSLIGMRPIVAIGETAFVPDEGECEEITKYILGG